MEQEDDNNSGDEFRTPHDIMMRKFNINRTVPERKKARLFVQAGSSQWGQLLYKLQKMLEKCDERSFVELQVDVKNATDLFKVAQN